MPEVSPSKYLVMAGWDDVPHLDAKTKRELLESTPDYLRDARSKGIPRLGDGLIFPIDEKLIKIDPFPIPDFWPRIAGLDFGWDHPTAVSWLAHDRDTDTIYLYDCYAASKTVIPIHASAIKSRGEWIPVAWPHDGYQVKDAMQGEQLAQQFRNEGVNMRPCHAQFVIQGVEDAPVSTVSVEAGLQEMLTRMQTGRFKVFSTLSDWFSELRLYRREQGKIVKINDDRICSTRYGMMDIRFAEMPPRQNAGKKVSVRGRNWRVM